MLIVGILPATISLNAHEQEILADINKLITAYGCIENGKYHLGSYVPTKVSLAGDIDDIEQIEGMKSLVGMPEESIMASYYSQQQVAIEVRSIIEKELPRGKTGALRLAAMWRKRMAEDRPGSGRYIVALAIIKEKSGLSNREIDAYYIHAMENEIRKITGEYFTSRYIENEMNSDLTLPLVAYYTNPSDGTEEQLVKAGIKLFNENKAKAEGFVNLLIKLNHQFAIKIISKIHEKRKK